MMLKKEVWKYDVHFWFPFLFYFGLIPYVLIAFFVFSDFFLDVLVLNLLHPTIIGLFASHYIHMDFPHLISNLFAYFFVMPFIFYFDYLSNKKMLYVNMLLLFLFLPLVTSLLNILSFSQVGITGSMKGFSAISAGVFGYLAFSLLNYIREHHHVRFHRSIFQLMWLILYVNLAFISIIYGYVYIGSIIIVLLLISIWFTYRDFDKIIRLTKQVNRVQRVMILMGLIISLSTVVIGLFPENIQGEDRIINIFAHYIGYIFGFFVPALVSEKILKFN